MPNIEPHPSARQTSVNGLQDMIMYGAQLDEKVAYIRLLRNPLIDHCIENARKQASTILFRVEDNALVTDLDGCNDWSNPSFIDRVKAHIDHIIDAPTVMTALKHVGKANGLIKHKWANDLEPINLWAYLTYPILREVGSALICRRIFSKDGGIVFQSSYKQFTAMPRKDFKGLVKHYFKTKSPRLIKALGKLIVSGHEVERVKLQMPETPQYALLINLIGDSIFSQHGYNVLERLNDGSYIVEGCPVIRNDLLMAGEWLVKVLPLDMIQELFEYLGSKVYLTHADPMERNNWQLPCMPHIDDAGVHLLLTMSPRKRLEVLRQIMIGEDSYLFFDTARMLYTYRDPQSIPESIRSLWPEGMKMPKTKTLKEAHDLIAKWDNQIRTEQQKRPITYGLHEEKVDGRLVHMKVYDTEHTPEGVAAHARTETTPARAIGQRTFMIRLPRSTAELMVWGNDLKNCIASYSEAAFTKHCTLAALFEMKSRTLPGTETTVPELELYGTLEVRYEAWEKPKAIVSDQGLPTEAPAGRMILNQNLGAADMNEPQVLELNPDLDYRVRLIQCVENCNVRVPEDLFIEVEKAFEIALQEALEQTRGTIR